MKIVVGQALRGPVVGWLTDRVPQGIRVQPVLAPQGLLFEEGPYTMIEGVTPEGCLVVEAFGAGLMAASGDVPPTNLRVYREGEYDAS